MITLEKLGCNKKQILEQFEGKEITLDLIAEIIIYNNEQIKMDIQKKDNDFFAKALGKKPIR